LKILSPIRSFTVFNVAQVDGLPRVMTDLPPLPEGWTPISAAEEVLTRSGATIRHGGDQAYYQPADDIIQMPH
jgi:antirestriction protein ArdC